MPQINIESTHSEICKKAAQHIAEQIRKKPDLALGLATGNTMEPLYRELVRMHNEDKLDFSQVQFFNLDEYKGLTSDNPISFNHYLRELFLNQINANPENIHLVQGTNFDPAAYEEQIKVVGGIDIQLVGIGGTGHIGFNEKGSTIDSRTREIELDERTKEDNAGLCGGKKFVPDHAYTQGIGTILEAKEVLMLGNGGHKAQVIHDMLEPGDIEELPARALMTHHNVKMYLDTPSAEMLSIDQLQQYSGMDAAAAKQFKQKFDPIRIDLGDDKILELPYNADIFIPGVMGVTETFNPRNAQHVEGLKTMLANVRETYMGAHQDDTEIEVPHAIEKNLEIQSNGGANQFLSIIATDGAAYTTALKREGKFAHLTPEELIEMRKLEQRDAAEEGKFGVIQLQYPSNSIKSQVSSAKSQEIVERMTSIYNALPNHETAYAHAPVDTHDTHVAVLSLATQALRKAEKKPKKLYGMEGWGELGIGDHIFPIQDTGLISQLLKKYVSQIEMQNRPYHKMAEGLALGHGFLADHHAQATCGGAVVGIDLTKAITENVSLDKIVADAFVTLSQKSTGMINRFAAPGSPETNGKHHLNGQHSSNGKHTNRIQPTGERRDEMPAWML